MLKSVFPSRETMEKISPYVSSLSFAFNMFGLAVLFVPEIGDLITGDSIVAHNVFASMYWLTAPLTLAASTAIGVHGVRSEDRTLFAKSVSVLATAIAGTLLVGGMGLFGLALANAGNLGAVSMAIGIGTALMIVGNVLSDTLNFGAHFLPRRDDANKDTNGPSEKPEDQPQSFVI